MCLISEMNLWFVKPGLSAGILQELSHRNGDSHLKGVRSHHCAQLARVRNVDFRNAIASNGAQPDTHHIYPHSMHYKITVPLGREFNLQTY